MDYHAPTERGRWGCTGCSGGVEGDHARWRYQLGLEERRRSLRRLQGGGYRRIAGCGGAARGERVSWLS